MHHVKAVCSLLWRASVLLIVTSIVSSEITLDTTSTSPNPTEIRDGKFFGLFDMAIYNNQACRALNGDIGTCLSYPECFAFRGTVSGMCGKGFGLCCINNKTCSGVIYGNNTYFVNQNYPQSYSQSGQCYVTVNRLTPNICQMRLDFEIFSISQPETTEHRCVTDSFLVTGTTNRVPVICGDNVGQHMYLNVGYNSTEPVVLTMITSNVVTSMIAPSRTWKIRVSQIPCNEGYAAPPGCLQYFTGPVGALRSFNFFFDAGSASSSRQLSYQDYTICIRQEHSFCEVQYIVCPDTVNNPGHGFTLTGSITSTDAAVASFTDSACSSDYLLVPCGANTRGQSVNSDGSVCSMRMCGSVLNSVNAQTIPAPVYSRSTPFELRFHTDGLEASAGDQGNLGFCLTYQQLPCPATTNNNINNFVV